MTHSGGQPHPETGDQGQRYEVRAQGYPRKGLNPIGWTEHIERAVKIAESIRKAPSCSRTEIYDRQDGQVIAVYLN